MPDEKIILPKEVWNRRARQWFHAYETDEQSARHGWNRAQQTADFLIKHGLLTKETIMADLGCGLGRFDIACAKTARHVTGFDFSPEMLACANIYAERNQTANTTFCEYDFCKQGVCGPEHYKKYDLVTSCLTPIVDNEEAISNMISFGNKWFFLSTIIRREDSLIELLRQNGIHSLKNKKENDEKLGAAFRFLTQKGYEPQVSCASDVKSEVMMADQSEITDWITRTLGKQPISEQDMDEIFNLLKKHSDENGLIRRDSIYRYGYMWWNIQ